MKNENGLCEKHDSMLCGCGSAEVSESKLIDLLSAREVELLEGMIEVQLHHAARCDTFANTTMAAKQKGWDMERVELLRKIIRTIGA